MPINAKSLAMILTAPTVFAFAACSGAETTVLSDAVVSIEELADDGGRLDWNPADQDAVAIDALGENGDYNIYTMDRSGGSRTPLTIGLDPGKHIGQPDYHPEGSYIAYQRENQYGTHLIFTVPGAGSNNDLWVMTADGTEHWPLVQFEAEHGLLHPHFSNDGTKLLWSELYNLESVTESHWQLAVADFVVEGGVPRVENAVYSEPAGLGIYEGHSFSPDDSRITSAFTPAGTESWDVFSATTDGNEVINLSESPGVWDEHAHISPSGNKIVWMSSRAEEGKDATLSLETEWYWMDIDGSNIEQLTAFNEARLQRVVAADLSWSADGSQIMGYAHTGNGSKEHVYLITLDDTY